MELPMYFVNRFVLRALEKAGKGEVSWMLADPDSDRFPELFVKIRDARKEGYAQVELSAEEMETLALALLEEMKTYASVTVWEYQIKANAKPIAASHRQPQSPLLTGRKS